MKTCVITGAAGFIGRHLTARVLEAGYNVIGIDNMSKPSARRMPIQENEAFRFIEADAGDAAIYENIKGPIEVFFHLADDSDIQYGFDHPASFFDNVSRVSTILAVCEQLRVRKLFFPSSTTVFGNDLASPYSVEDGPLQPESLYGASKLAIEAFLRAWTIGPSNIDVRVLRFAAIIGAGQDHGVVHDFCLRLSTKPEKLKVFGDGSQLRQFVLADDCVAAIVEFCEAPSLGKFKLAHLGNSDLISIKEVASLVAEQFGFDQQSIEFEKEALGWKGDSYTNELSTKSLDDLGIQVKNSTAQAVSIATRYLKAQYT